MLVLSQAGIAGRLRGRGEDRTPCLGPHVMRDGERSERLLTCRTASNGYKHFSAVKRVSRIRLLRIEMIYLDGLARTQIVLNGGPVAVTAAPATGRLKADP